jgi:hypothetical protein
VEGGRWKVVCGIDPVLIYGAFGLIVTFMQSSGFLSGYISALFIARGNSVAHIAKTLIISENTVRFHSKNVYMKLGIHKRQDLIALLEETD